MVLCDFPSAVAGLWNFRGVKFGTIKDLQATLGCLLVTFYLRLEWI